MENTPEGNNRNGRVEFSTRFFVSGKQQQPTFIGWNVRFFDYCKHYIQIFV